MYKNNLKRNLKNTNKPHMSKQNITLYLRKVMLLLYQKMEKSPFEFL
ncbi:hypothetical protein HPHPH1_0588 [Helicobacter pylori Hp H-1]|uniref:Uncharacterized protein n=1 Tax=Helicobacter pylori Hp H-1 TaxID=992058 RepID=M7SME0_HELPX|nr:hypothetical protein HMPREF1412_01128 [Helicobacter pylori GAM250T]EMH52127.1 hypothetical protein HMPREF1442_01013 [Helicobacter pylori HP250ASii]EMR59001.1 hypothetical protein HPHPH1_0588 [Helicobacter pylori Hp H-1]